MAALHLQGIGKRYHNTAVLNGIDLEVGASEFVTLLGPSGCGKSTLLRLIAGFEAPDEGEIHVAGRPMRGVPTYDRPLTMMFQSLALFPNMDVAANTGYGLRVRGVRDPELSSRVKNALDLVGLAGMGSRRVTQLSGGQRQRVALARCLVIRPALLLLDEPLAALDLQLRRQLQLELKDVQRQTGCAFIYVTHDQEEAMTMSDRIAVMRAGRVEQIGHPSDIYSHPRNSFVASFVGEVNLLNANALGPGQSKRIAIRPELLAIHKSDAPTPTGGMRIQGLLSAATQIGSMVRYRVETAVGTLVAIGLAGTEASVRVGDPVALICRAADAVPVAD